MENNKGKIIVIVIILTVIAAAAAEYYSFYARTKGAKVKLSIGLVGGSIYSAPLLVAENEGFFEEEGLDMEIKIFDSGIPAMAAMLERGSPSIIAPATTPIVLNSFSRSDYAIFAASTKLKDSVKLLVREDVGIRAPADLMGKKIGTTKGTIGHYFLDLFLEQNGLSISDVEIVDLKASEMVQALSDEQVDAISVWEPHIFNAKKVIGAWARAFLSKGLLRENTYFVAKKDFIENNRDVLERFLRAVENGNNFVKNRPLTSIDIVSQRMKIDKIIVVSLWEQYEFGLFLDSTVLASLEDEARWAIENKLVDAAEIPNYSEYIYQGILDDL